MDIRKGNTACADSAQTEMLKEAIHIVREDFLKTCKGESSSIEHIERLAEYAYRTICSQMEPLESHHSCAFTDQDVFRLKNLAVAIYLEEWLENDENARQTIYSFADRKYILQSEYSNTTMGVSIMEKNDRRDCLVFTVKEVAELLRTNASFVYRLIELGLLPALKLGSIRVRKEALEDFLKEHEGEDLSDPTNIKSVRKAG